jgi:hypothetical protein
MQDFIRLGGWQRARSRDVSVAEVLGPEYYGRARRVHVVEP